MPLESVCYRLTYTWNIPDEDKEECEKNIAEWLTLDKWRRVALGSAGCDEEGGVAEDSRQEGDSESRSEGQSQERHTHAGVWRGPEHNSSSV